MMKAIIAILFALMSLQLLATQNPEDMYGEYDKDGKYRAMQEQVDKMNQQIAKAEEEKSEKQTMALWFALAAGLIPLLYLGKMIVQKKTWQDNPSGTVQALAIGLVGGIALFALNYGVFWLKIEYGSKFNSALAVALVLLLITGAIYILKKKEKN